MRKTDLHIHTTFSDGVNSPEECVIYAINMGFDEIGFSDHSYISHPSDIVYWKGPEFESIYKAEIERLKYMYKGKIDILCGIEQDYYSDHPAEGYDYIIGAVHFIKTEKAFVGVDEPADYTLQNLKYFDGDIYTFAEEYYKREALVVEKTNCDIIAHFDLISKYNEVSNLFDVNNPRYVKAWQSAADKLLKTGKPFEINAGAMAKGLTTLPYPSKDIIEYLRKRGAKFILSSDAHKKENIGFMFGKFDKI